MSLLTFYYKILLKTFLSKNLVAYCIHIYIYTQDVPFKLPHTNNFVIIITKKVLNEFNTFKVLN